MSLTGSIGFAYAKACNAEWQTYYSLRRDYTNLVRDLTTTYWRTTTSFSASVTTWCATVPYVVGTLEAVASQSFLTTWETAVQTYGGPTPGCSIGPQLCSQYVDVLPTSGPQCPFPATSSRPADCGPCYIQGGTVQMYYFPVTASSTANPCPPSNINPGTQCPYGTYVPWGNLGFGSGQETTCSLSSFNFSTTRDSGN